MHISRLFLQYSKEEGTRISTVRDDDSRYNLWVYTLTLSAVPNSIGNLQHLSHLTVEGYYVWCTAAIPVSMAVINRLSSLKVLSLNSVHIDQPDIAISTLTDLRIFQCSIGQGTSYDILASVNQYCTNIELLHLKYTSREIDKCKNRNCSECSAVLPPVCNRDLPINKLTKLRELVLIEVLINASLPSNIDTLSSIKRLHIYCSMLTGTVPLSVLKLPRLKSLVILDNGYLDMDTIDEELFYKRPRIRIERVVYKR